MNKLKLKRTDSSNVLSAALDRSVEAAVHLDISESDLVALLRQRLHAKTTSNVVPLRQQQRKMYNPEAGP